MRKGVYYDRYEGGSSSLVKPMYKYQVKINGVKEFNIFNKFAKSKKWSWLSFISDLKEEWTYKKDVYIIIDEKQKYLSFTHKNKEYEKYIPYNIWQRKEKVKKILL